MVYERAFNLFLKNTNEKAVVLEFIKNHISLDRTTKFLDIGAGEGSLCVGISAMVGETLAIEPNRRFFNLLKKEGIPAIHSKWEDVKLHDKYSFILAAYVVTYFPSKERKLLISKMYDLLSPGGQLLILSVDATKGSWRAVHTYFYQLLGILHLSSDEQLVAIQKEYNCKTYSFVTNVTATCEEEMLDILSFDFGKYGDAFPRYRDQLREYLKTYRSPSGEVSLEMVHNATIITKEVER